MSVYVWTKELVSAAIGSWPNDEYIEYKILATSEGKLYIPTTWTNHTSRSSGTVWADYNWKVYIDWVYGITVSWTAGSSSGKLLSGSFTAWQEYTIKIVPVTIDYWWALAYCWYWASSTYKSLLTEVTHCNTYVWYALSATDTWNYFRYWLFYTCTTLTSIEDEYMPDTVKTVWTDFRGNEFYWCTGLTKAAKEAYSSSITSIWNYFRELQYSWCTNITEVPCWIDSSVGSSWYRNSQFNGCTKQKTVKVYSDVWYAAVTDSTLSNSYVSTVYVPSAYLNNFKNSTKRPWVNITDSKFTWY